MSTQPSPIVPDPAYAALVGWLRRARDLVAASAPAIDAINVFPAPDADTGTNVTLTLTAAVEAAAAGPEGLGNAAVVAAHGNSGAVIGQMVSVAVDRLPALRITGLRNTESCGGWLAETLREATVAATAAVAEPVRGTVLTVASAAAQAAEEAAKGDGAEPLRIARAAERAASAALARTTEQLPELRTAGVVDAGGLAFLLLLRALVEVLGGEPARPLPAPTATARERSSIRPAAGCAYEVMYLLDGADGGELDRLRNRLSEVADSVVVVTARTGSSAPQHTAKVHAHLTRPALAIAPGLAVGTVSALRVTPLGEPAPPAERRPLVIIDDPGQDELVRAHGGLPVPQDDPDPAEPLPARLAAVLAGAGPEAILVLPANAEPAVRAALELVAGAHRVELVRCAGSVSTLSALAVHEPTAGAAEAATAMRSAAARVRTGSADSADDVMAMITDLAGGPAELITVIADPTAASASVELGRRIAATYPAAEVELLTGAHRGAAFLIGVEP